MSGWKWCTDVLGYKDKCDQCAQPLRGNSDVVEWTNGKRYHVGCLLDWVAAFVNVGGVTNHCEVKVGKRADPDPNATPWPLPWNQIGGMSP